jgi:signal transduction histidine kinase
MLNHILCYFCLECTNVDATMITSKNILPLLFIAFIAMQSRANIDSLRHAYDTQKGEEKIITGIKLAEELIEEPGALYALSKELLTFTEKQSSRSILHAKVLRSLSDAYYYLDSLQLSVVYARKAIEVAEKLTPLDSQFLGSICNNVGLTMQNTTDKHMSIHYLHKAIEYLNETPFVIDMADAKSNLATYFHSRGNYEEAIRLYQEVYQLDLKTGNRNKQSSSLNSLGRMYVDWGKHEIGLDFYMRSIALLDTVQDRRMLGVRYNNVGMVYQIMGAHNEAIQWIEKAKHIEEPYGQTPRLAARYFNLGNSYMALRDREKAQDNFEKAEAIFVRSEMDPQLSKVYGSLGQLYLYRNEHQLAETYLLKSKYHAVEGGSLPELSNCYKHLYEYYKQTGNYRESLHYFELHGQAEDSIFNIKVSEQVEEMQAQYQSQQKEAEIARLESENELNRKEIQFRKRERNLAVAGILGLLLVAVGMYFLLSTVKRQEQKLALQNKELDRLNKTLNRLFAILSHDLRNATAAYQSSAKVIQYHLEKGNPEKLIPIAADIQTNAKNVSTMLENLLHWSVMQLKGVEPKKEQIDIKDEIEKILSLFTDEASKKSNVIEVDTDEDSTAWCDRESFALIMRNLIGNALKFTTNGKVTISSTMNDGHVTLTVRDTGCGIPDEMKESILTLQNEKVRTGTGGEKGTGLGLMMVAHHVAKNGGTIRIESTEGNGSSFYVQLLSKNHLEPTLKDLQT